MPIRFSCACGRSIAVKDEHAGKLIKCPACAKPVRVPKDELDLKPDDGGGDGGHGLELKEEGLEAKTDPLATGTKTRSKSQSVAKAVKLPAGGSSGGTSRSSAGGPRRSKSKTRPGMRPPPLGDDLMGGRVPPVTTRRQTEFEIKPMEGVTAKGGKKSFKCPGCQATLYEGDILCIACGMDLSTGQWVAPKEAESKGWIWLILGLLLLAGLIGVVVYVFKKGAAEVKGAGAGAGAGSGTETPAPPAEDATTPLRKLLAGGSMFDFKKVAEELGKLKEEALPVLVENWKGEGSAKNTRKLALHGLGLLARAGLWNDDVVEAFQTTVRDKASDERELALQGLYRIAFERADGPLDPDEFTGTEGLFKGVKRMAAVPTVRAVFSEVASETGDPLCAWAVRFATDLGDQTAVHVLIAGLTNAELARDAIDRFKVMLRELTGVTFDTPEQWEAWWQERQSDSPVQWLVRALEGQNDLLRAAAAKRLKRLTGANLPDWETAGSAEKRAELIKKWQAWAAENKGK